MTEKEYFGQIEIARNHIKQERLEKAEALLTKIYAYKPVRLLWYVANAELILKKEQNPTKALSSLGGKYILEEDYSGLKECMEFRVNTLNGVKDKRNAGREDYTYRRICGEDVSAEAQRLSQAMEQFAEDSDVVGNLNALAEGFYRTSDMVSYFILRMEQLRRGAIKKDNRKAWFYRISNFSYLEEMIRSEKERTFILVMDGYTDRSLEILGFILAGFGHRIFLLSLPLAVETEKRVELSDTLSVSLDNLQKYPDMVMIPPVELVEDGVSYGDNRAVIIDYLCKEKSGEDLGLLLGSGKMLERLFSEKCLQGRSGRLSNYEENFKEEQLQFGWAGSYLSYISQIYGYDVRSDLEAEPEVDFSILIPARNSAATLRYTLKTCLNQRYEGSYEIVVSDNSVDEDTSVYDLCRELNDSRIRYVRTPRLLQLTKSFEFGYLKTRGTFILSMGSDDGLLPWALSTLKQVLDQFPKEEIILWDRGFYAWPGFNGGQENMFEIPQKYEAGRLQGDFVETKKLLELVKEETGMVYLLPLLYLNSGFRRSYLKTLLEKTGKLWDGCNQDLQTGIVNCCINERILRIAYPIIIAGMSDSSVGYLEGCVSTAKERIKTEEIRKRIHQQENMGIYVARKREKQLLAVGIDPCSFYVVLSRAVEEGLMTEEEADEVQDWKKAVTRAFERYPMTRENYDLFLHHERIMARRMGGKLRKWFEREIYQQAIVPRYLEEGKLEEMKAKKTYQEGVNQLGGETLDASKFGIKNIEEAVRLFAERTGL